MPASKANARGFFESAAVRDLNDELLAAAGSSWDDFTPFHRDWLRTPEADDFLDRAVSLLRSEFANARLFVLKDPRICRLVPFWTEALSRFGCAVKPVLTVRNPLEVGHSLFSKKRLSEPLGQMIWLRHVLDAERATRATERFSTSFEQLMLGWESVAEKAQEALHIVWPKPPKNVEREIETFLSGDLRHFSKTPKDVARRSILPEWLRETYDILNRWAEAGESAQDYEALDRIASEFDQASAAFLRVVHGERAITLEQMKRAQAVEASGAAREAELESKIRGLTKERDAVKSQVVETLANSEKERSASEALRQTLEARAVALDESLRRHKEASESELAALKSSIAESAAARDALESRSAELEQSLQEQRSANARDREAFDSSLAASEAARQALESRLAETAGEYEKARSSLQDEIARATATREMLERQLAEIEQSLESEKRESDSRHEELHRLTKAAAESARSSGELKKSLQESRREATLLKAEVHQLMEERESLVSELAASRDRRKEASRLIARRDAEIKARYQELAALELHILQSSLSWKVKSLWQNVGRGSGRPGEPGPQGAG